MIGLYSHRCPSRTGATERGSRPSPLGWASPHSKCNCGGAAPCRALLPPPSLSHRADPNVSRGCGRHPTPRPLFTREYPFRRPRRAKHISTTLAGPEELVRGYPDLEDVGATPHLDHCSHESIRSATPVEPSISRPPSPAPKSRTGHPGGRLGRKSYLSPTESGKSGSTVRFRPADEFGFFRVPLPYIDNWSVAFHNQKKKKATAMGLRKFGNHPKGVLPAPPRSHPSSARHTRVPRGTPRHQM